MSAFRLSQRFLRIMAHNSWLLLGSRLTILSQSSLKFCQSVVHFLKGLSFSPHTSFVEGHSHRIWDIDSGSLLHTG